MQGRDFAQIKDEIIEYQKHTGLIFALENMHNLANNGRVSSLKARMAGILGIRAIGKASEQGTLEMICKSRGPINAVADIFTNMKSEGYCGGRVRIHHANNLSVAEMLKKSILAEYPKSEVFVGTTCGLCSFYAEQGGILVGFEGK